jgi:hypothetical protein
LLGTPCAHNGQASLTVISVRCNFPSAADRIQLLLQMDQPHRSRCFL